MNIFHKWAIFAPINTTVVFSTPRKALYLITSFISILYHAHGTMKYKGKNLFIHILILYCNTQNKRILFHHFLFLLDTNLKIISWNSLLILAEAICQPPSQMKFGDSQNQKCSNRMHLIFSHHRMWWHHWCHSNLGLETTGHKLVEMPTRRVVVWGRQVGWRN